MSNHIKNNIEESESESESEDEDFINRFRNQKIATEKPNQNINL